MTNRLLQVLACVFLAFSVSSCGYNRLQRLDEESQAAWSEVLNQYKRRADLVPNLVKIVKGYASHEREVLENVTEARSKVGSVQLPENPTQGDLQQYQDAQRQLGGALSRLLVVAENYPQLKADANFRELQAQLEGTENRIAVARGRYIKAVQEFNIAVRSFPSNLTAKLFGLKTKPNFTVENEREISQPPEVNL
jgi:LemA protein